MNDYLNSIRTSPLSNVNIVEIVATDLSENDIPQYVANLETYIARVKEIHWSCDNDKTHVLCDELASKLKSYQDEIAEDYMGYTGTKFKLGFLNSACSCDATTLPDLLKALQADTTEMYDVVHGNTGLKGIEHILNGIMDTVNTYLYKETQK